MGFFWVLRFLQQYKNMQYGCIEDPKLSVGVNVCVCESQAM